MNAFRNWVHGNNSITFNYKIDLKGYCTYIHKLLATRLVNGNRTCFLTFTSFCCLVRLKLNVKYRMKIFDLIELLNKIFNSLLTQRKKMWNWLYNEDSHRKQCLQGSFLTFFTFILSIFQGWIMYLHHALNKQSSLLPKSLLWCLSPDQNISREVFTYCVPGAMFLNLWFARFRKGPG